MEQENTSELIRRYFASIKRWFWLLLVAVGLTGIAAFLVSRSLPPVYEASTTIMIDQAPDSRLSEYQAVLTSQQLSTTFANLISARPIVEEVISRLELDMEVEDLLENVKIQPVRDTPLIKIRVENVDPLLASQIANTFVDVFIEQNKNLQETRYAKSRQSLENQIQQLNLEIQRTDEELQNLEDLPENQAKRDYLNTVLFQYRQIYASLVQSLEDVRMREAQSTTDIVLVENAVAPNEPVRPRVLMITLIASMVGLFFAVALIFLLEVLDETIQSPEEFTRLYNFPVLGFINHQQIENGKPITLEQPRSTIAESFRSLRTNIQYASVDKNLRTLLITSASSDEGKTNVASNLAVVLAEGGRRVLLIDSDLRRPKVHQIFQLSNRIGLSGLFLDSGTLFDAALQQTEIQGLQVLTSGAIPPNPSELLSSDKMSAILEQAYDIADVVVIDSVPVLSATDTSVISRLADGVLLIIMPGVSKRSSVNHAIDQLQHVNASIIGVVFNGVDSSRSKPYY